MAQIGDIARYVGEIAHHVVSHIIQVNDLLKDLASAQLPANPPRRMQAVALVIRAVQRRFSGNAVFHQLPNMLYRTAKAHVIAQHGLHAVFSNGVRNALGALQRNGKRLFGEDCQLLCRRLLDLPIVRERRKRDVYRIQRELLQHPVKIIIDREGSAVFFVVFLRVVRHRAKRNNLDVVHLSKLGDVRASHIPHSQHGHSDFSFHKIASPFDYS